MTKDIILFEKFWGILTFSVSSSRVDVLPSFWVADLNGMTMARIGFLCISLKFTLWDKSMQEFNRKIEKYWQK